MAKKKALLELPVNFGQVSIGDKTARIGATCQRTELTLRVADETLCEARLDGCIVAKPPDENADQGTFPGMEDETLKGTFDVKGFSVTSEQISLGLTFAIKSVDVSLLAHFAKRSGKMIVWGREDLDTGDDEEDGKEEE